MEWHFEGSVNSSVQGKHRVAVLWVAVHLLNRWLVHGVMSSAVEAQEQKKGSMIGPLHHQCQ